MFKSYFKVGSWTGLSRVFGLLRDITTTSLLGSSMLHDIFVVVLKIPNVFRRFFAEGAFSQDLDVLRSKDAKCPLALAIEKALILLSVPLAPPQDVK